MMADKVAPVRGLNFKIYNDLGCLGSHSLDPGVLVTPKVSPYNTLQKFFEAAKNTKMKFGITRYAQVDTLIGLQLSEQTGVKFQIIPHGGNNVMKPALAGGHIDAAIAKVSPMYSIRDSLWFIGTFYKTEFGPDSFAYSPVVNKVLGTNVMDVQEMRSMAVHSEVKSQYPERYRILKETYDMARKDPRFVEQATQKLGYLENTVGMMGDHEDIIRYMAETAKLIDKYQHLLVDEKR